MYITFDFDGTLQHKGLPRKSLVKVFKMLPNYGITPIVLTTRRDVHLEEVKKFCVDNFGYTPLIYNTNFMWKAEYLMTFAFCGLEYNFNGLTKDNYLFHIDDNHDEFVVWQKCGIQKHFGATMVMVTSMNKFFNYLRTIGLTL